MGARTQAFLGYTSEAPSPAWFPVILTWTHSGAPKAPSDAGGGPVVRTLAALGPGEPHAEDRYWGREELWEPVSVNAHMQLCLLEGQ